MERQSIDINIHLPNAADLFKTAGDARDATAQAPAPKPQISRYRVWVQLRKTRDPMSCVRYEMNAVALRQYTVEGAEIYLAVRQQEWNPRPGAYCQLFFLNTDHMRQVAFPGEGSEVNMDDAIHHDQYLLMTHDGDVTYDGGPPLVLGDAEQGGLNIYDPRVAR